MTEYLVRVLQEDHPMYGEYFYDVKKYINKHYQGEGRYCRDLEDVYKYLAQDAEK